MRPIVIDGPNVAWAHGNDQYFSATGIEIVVNWFVERGHESVVAFIPKHNYDQANQQNRIVLDRLKESGNLVPTPSRMVGERRITSYDDR